MINNLHKNTYFIRGLYCPPLIPAGIRAIPGIPEESNLAEGPAKLMNNSGGILNGIQIPPEWFQELPGRNAAGIQRNGIDDAHSFSTTIIAHDAHLPLHLSTITNGRRHAHPSRTTTTARTTWQRHVTKRTSASHSNRDGRCHVAVGDVATKRRTTTMSSFVVSVDLITVSTPLLHPKATR